LFALRGGGEEGRGGRFVIGNERISIICFSLIHYSEMAEMISVCM